MCIVLCFILLIGVLILILQIVIFGGQRSEVVEYFERNHVALKHLLLKGWEPSYETMPYPPATGAFAIYHKNDFFDSIDHAWQQVCKKISAVGSSCVYCFMYFMQFCFNPFHKCVSNLNIFYLKSLYFEIK